MAKKHLEQYDKNGTRQDIYLNDDEVMVGDKTLEEKLGDMQTAINNAASQGGIQQETDPTVPSWAKQPTKPTYTAQEVGAVPAAGYVATTNDYTTAEKTKLAGIAAGAQVNTITSISVNGTPQQPVQGNVNINVQGTAGQDGITPHIGSNGNWWIGPETDPNNDTGIKAQGPAGTSITDADLVIGNALNGQGDVLGMSGAMMIKNNLDFVYGKLQALFDALGNIAFWEGKPANLLPQSLDWSVPKKTVTLDLSDVDSNVIVSDGNNTYDDGDEIQVDEGSELTLVISAESGYYLDSLPTASVDQDTIQVVDNNNGTYSVTIDSVTANITLNIEATADEVPQVSVTKNLTGVEVDSETQNVAYNQLYELTIKRHKYYFPLGTYPNDETLTVTMGGTDITSSAWDASTGKISIAHVTGVVVITMTAVSYIKYNYYLAENDGSDTPETGYAITDCYIKIPSNLSDYTFFLKPGLNANDSKCGVLEYTSSFVRNENWTQKYLGPDSSITHTPKTSSVYLRLSMFMDGGTIKSGAYLKMNSKATTLFDTDDGLQGCTVYYNGVETTFPAISQS